MSRGLPREHLRDIQQVKGLSCGGVVVEVLLRALVLVLDQRQRPEQHLRDLRSQAVLHLPLQLHPPVLEPGSDLRRGSCAQNQGDTADLQQGFPRGPRPTWVSVRPSLCAVFILSPASRYLCLPKIFSSLAICSVVNLVRTRRCCGSFSVSSTEGHSEEAASLSYPEEYPLISETGEKGASASHTRSPARIRGFSLGLWLLTG